MWFITNYERAGQTHPEPVRVYACDKISNVPVYRAQTERSGSNRILIFTPSIEVVGNLINELRNNPCVIEILDQSGIDKHIHWINKLADGIRPLQETEAKRLPK